MWKRLPIHYCLSYLETGGADTSIQPWFWIAWLFVGPIVQNVCNQWYLFIVSRTSVRIEGLLTQLVFEHSLRIRLKAEASNEKTEEDNLTVIGTQDSALVVEGEAVDSISDEGSDEPSQASTAVTRDSSRDSQSTSNAVKGNDKDDSSTVKSNAKQPTKKAQNLIGKVNNLVTTDLGNIGRGLEFLMISAFQSFRLSLDLLSDTPTSSIYPTSNSPMHHLLI